MTELRRIPRLALSAITAAMLVAGCTSLAPTYERPAAPVPAVWGNGSPAAGGAVNVADIGWQQFFNDDRLRQLVALALENNRDLRVASLNIERARAQYGVQGAELYPRVSAAASVTPQRVPDSLSPTGQATTLTQYRATLGFSAWELDFFGRIRNLQDSAFQQYLATEEARKTAQISLVAEVANVYLTLAADQERLELASQTLKNQQDSYRLTQRSFDLGVSSALEVRQAQTSIESARGEVARYTGLIAQDRNALMLLVGTNLTDALLPPVPLQNVATLEDLPAGVPSEVLQRRPDVVGAERRLQAANANIGAARAAFFPSVSLTATAGLASSALSKLFSGGAGLWSFAPLVNVPIFDGGRNRGNLAVAEADRDIAVAQYERAIQGAFREVSDSLAQRGTLGAQLDAQVALVEATSAAYRLSEARFRAGVDSYLNVLDAQRSLYAAQQGLITLRLARAGNLVTVYKVLGGGWKDTTGR